jgi:scyllo-inositol 2-dehydrogenase (NADP+)
VSIRTAVVGFGLSGRVFHAPLIGADPRYSLDLVMTGDADRARAAQEQYPGVQICASTDELFDRAEDIDLVVIGSPPATHAELAHRGLDAGVAVVVDKPFCVSATEGRKLVDRSLETGALLTVFQNRRWDGDFLTVRSLLAGGALGDVRRFESHFDRWQPQPSKQWKAETPPSAGGGILFDLGTHLLDQALQLFGPVESSYAELTSYAGNGIDDDSFVSLLHRSGVRSHLTMTTSAAQVGPRFRVLGSTSAYTKWGLDGQEAALGSGSRPTDPEYGAEPENSWGRVGLDGDLTAVPTSRGSYDDFYGLLAKALLDGGPPPVDPLESLEVIAIIEDLHRRFGVVNP